MLPLIIYPSLNIDPRTGENRAAYSGRGPLYDGKIYGRVVITRSTQPLCDACRVLIAEGMASETRIVMRHEGSDIDCLISTVGAAAKVTISEGERRPIAVRWQEHPNSAAGSSPVRFSDDPLPQ
jgi:hypothetical protein